MGKTKKTTAAPTVTESVSQPSPNKPGYFAHGGRKIAVFVAVLLLIAGVGGAVYRVNHKSNSANTAKTGSAQTKAYDLISQANDATQNSDYNTALKKYFAADQAWPNQPLILSNIGSTYFILKDKDNSIHYYERAINATKSDKKTDYKASIANWQATIDQAKNNDFEFHDGAVSP